MVSARAFSFFSELLLAADNYLFRIASSSAAYVSRNYFRHEFIVKTE